MAKAREYYIGGVLCLIISIVFFVINKQITAGVIGGIIVALISFVQGMKTTE